MPEEEGEAVAAEVARVDMARCRNVRKPRSVKSGAADGTVKTGEEE